MLRVRIAFILAQLPFFVAVAMWIDVLGRFVPHGPEHWILGRTELWWPILASGVGVGLALQAIAWRTPLSTLRRWILGIAWGSLLGAQVFTFVGVFGLMGGLTRLALAFLDAAGGWVGMATEVLVTTACLACFLRVVRASAKPGVAPMSRPPTRWPYWVAMPLGALLYLTACMAFALEAWGRRGEVKPAWFEIASWITLPGMFLPVVGPAGIGAAVGFLGVRLGKWIIGAFTRRRPERQ